MIVLIGETGGQRVAVNRIGGVQGLIRPEVERLVRDDNLAVEMCVRR